MINSKKGVESIIAVLIIVMITVASAGSFYFWYQRVQQSAQGATEQSTKTFLNQINTCVKMPYFAYNLLTNQSESQVQNCGSTSVTIGDGDDNVLISSQPCAFAVDSQVCDTCPLKIGPGAIGTFKMNFNNAACSGTTNKTAASVLADQGNIQHKVSFSMEKSTISVSKSFVPESQISCELALTGPSIIAYPHITCGPGGCPPCPGYHACAIYNVSLIGNVAQNITFSSSISPPSSTVSIYAYHSGGEWTYENCYESENITQITAVPNANTTFFADVLWFCGDMGSLTVTIQSTDLNTCKSTASSTAITT